MANIERLQSNIKRSLSQIIARDVKDSKVRFVTITDLTLTSDLSFLTVYYTVLGSENKQDSVAKALERAKGFIRGQLGKQVQLRKVPALIFKYDDSLDYGNKIDRILHDIKKD